MGLPPEEFVDIGATRFQRPRSSKESDSAYKPATVRPNRLDWPTLVIEAGMSESLRRLRSDARWWLENSGGEVKIVVIMSIRRTSRLRTIVIEKWEHGPLPGNRPNTRSITAAAANAPNQLQQIPTGTQEISIDSNTNTVNGAPLVLEFRKFFSPPGRTTGAGLHVYCAGPFELGN